MSSSPTDQSEIAQPSPTTMGESPSNTGAVIGAIIAVLSVAVVVVLAVCLWYYFKRRKQTHSFRETHETHDSTPTFRALSAWEEAVSNQQTQKDTPEYPPKIPSGQMSYPKPDLIPGTYDNDVIQNNQYGRLRNETITSENSNLPTIEEESERPLSGEFENPGFELLDELLDPSLFTGRIVLDGESSPEEESDDERKSQMDLEKNVAIIEPKPADEATMGSHNEEDDHVSTKEKELSDDLNVEIASTLQITEMVNDTNSEDIENGLDNAAFEMETDIEGNDTSTESPAASSDIDNST